MAKVHILPEQLANQIAAGEVVERPAAVVKELVENALDAGASRVTVEFAHSGRALIRVEDNGQGMSALDARTALQRHATSKISESEDLNRLKTFGFRGEALPSIASVSRFTLQTREAASQAGTEISVNAGRIVHERACGRPVGTRIDVEHLFESVPARRKFLKSDRTESGHIVTCVRLYALACPAVSFALFEDGREVFRSPECPGLAERIGEIFGEETALGLIPLDVSEQGMRLHGLVGRPGSSRTNRHEMVSFVNSRPVDSRTVNGALLESYREFLPAGRYPVAFLFLECAPGEVDVNVHPAKREVRFRAEPLVRSFIIRAVQGALGRRAAPAGPAPAIDWANAPLPAPFQAWEPPAPAPMAWPAPGAEPAAPPAAPPAAEPGAVPRWRYLGTAHGAYALFETLHGLILLDQRAAHERIWFERLRAEFRDGGVPVQRLLLPVPLELGAVDSAVLMDHLDFLRTHGLEIGEFGRNFFRIEAVPSWLEPGDAAAFARDLVGAIREGRIPASNLDLAREELARLAAAKAVRPAALRGDEAAAALLRELFQTTSPVSAPDGRQTFVEFNHGELARRFQK